MSTVDEQRVGCPDLGGDTDTRRMDFELSILTDEAILMIRREVRDGASIAEVAARYRLRWRSVIRVVSQHGHRPGTVLGESPVKRFTTAQADELVLMSRAMQAAYPGLSLGEVATRWGIPRQQLVNWTGSTERRARLAAQDAETDAELLE